MPRFVILDGNALVHRAFHALPPLTTKDGKVVNAVYGFISILLKVIKDLKPDYLAATFDLAAPTFRHKEYEAYKAKRIKQPQELYDQLPLVKDLLGAMGVPIYEKEGYEADDVICTVAQKLKTQNSKLKIKEFEIIIVTGDLDTLQLVDEQTKVHTLKKGVSEIAVYDEKAVEERFGLKPEQMIDYKALRGDPSDNIPGVKGIGEKTAGELIKRFGSIEHLYEILDIKDIKDIKKQLISNIPARTTGAARVGGQYPISPSMLDKLIKGKKDAIFSKHLVELVKDVPIKFDLEDCRLGDYRNEKVKELLRKWEFGSLLKRLESGGEESGIKNQELGIKRKDYKIIEIKNKSGVEELNKELEKAKKAAVYLSDDGQNGLKAKLFGLALTCDGRSIYHISPNLINNIQYPCLAGRRAISNIKIYGYDLKKIWEILKRYNFKVEGWLGDVMVMDYLLNPGSRAHDLKTLVLRHLGIDLGEGGQGNLFGLDFKKEAQKAGYLWQLGEKLTAELKEKGLFGLYEKIEAPLIPVLARMEEAGVKVDLKCLEKVSQEIKNKEEKIKSKIFELAGEEFNVASPQQLKEILFDKLQIPIEGIRRGKTGLSTAASELEKMRGLHPIIDLIFEERELAKLRNTYADVLPTLIDTNDKRIHTNFNQAVTATGRLSSSEPNLQNIPIRSELGRKIRQCFVAEKGYKLLSADYSQIELRIIASLANDKEMIEIFQRGEDIHVMTAAKINGVGREKVTPEMRQAAKAINFGIIYGLGPQGLAEGTGLTFSQAKEFIQKYFAVFKEVKEFLDQTRALAHSLGYVETLFGRRRYLPEINSQMVQLRNAAERMAINAPVQGTAADLMKLAMIEIDKTLIKNEFETNRNEFETRMILQVHDELVFEVRENLVEKFGEEVKMIMENVVKLRVPVEAEVKAGERWGFLSREHLIT